MRNDNPLWPLVDARAAQFTGLADAVFDTPELAYGEVKSCAAHTRMLRDQGFRVTENLAGIPTAVMGEAGTGGPIIAILGEYDALPGLSQEPGLAEPRQIADHGFGHGCGHNLLGSAALPAPNPLCAQITGTPSRRACSTNAWPTCGSRGSASSRRQAFPGSPNASGQ